jgi:hypothetical protein
MDLQLLNDDVNQHNMAPWRQKAMAWPLHQILERPKLPYYLVLGDLTINVPVVYMGP